MNAAQPVVHDVEGLNKDIEDSNGNTSLTASEKTGGGEDLEQAPQTQSKAEDVPPDGGYGWVVVACCFLINGHTWGINSSYGVFLAYYLANDVYPGSTPLEYAFIGGLSIAMCQTVSPVATTCVRKYGTRTTLLIGVFLLTAALLGASWSTQIWQLFLSQGICFGWGMGFLFVGSVGLIPQWFDKRRSLANSIGAAGSGFGGLIYSLATNAMIQSIGLGWAFRILAIVSLLVNGVCAILIRDRNKAVGSIHQAFSVELCKRPEFLLLLGWGVFSMLGYIVLLFSLPNYAQSIGLTAQQGSVVGALLNLGQGLGRPFIGYFSDSAGRMNIALLGTFLSGFFCLVIWIFATNYGVLIFFSLLSGIFAGTFWCTIGVVAAETTGLRMLPSALSILWIVLILPSAFSEVIGLQLKATTGNIYLHAQIFTGFMYIAAALCLWFLRAWKVRNLEKLASEDARRREAEVRDDEKVLHNTDLARTVSVAVSVKSKVKAARGLWSWQRV